jgi:hypothetical protein
MFWKRKTRSEKFLELFVPEERVAIINALYRRVDDDRTKDIHGEQNIRSACSRIAKELIESKV